MAWQTISDIRRNCRYCNKYRVMEPQDLGRKQLVLTGLQHLQHFFEQKLLQLTVEKNAVMGRVIIIKKNREICEHLHQECLGCDRSIDWVNKQIILLK